MAPPKQPQPKFPEPAKKRSLMWLWVGIAAVILIAGVVAVATSGDDKELSVGSVPTTVAGATPDTGSTPASVEPAEVWPVTITGSTLPALPTSGTDAAVGTAAPTLSGYTFDGTPVTIDWSQGPTLVVVLAHWCPHCNREVPEINKWRDSGKVPADLKVVAITTAVDPSRPNYPPSQWIVDKGWTWPVLADSQNSDAAIALGVSGFPYSIIVGADGNVLGRISGELGAGYGDWVAATLA